MRQIKFRVWDTISSKLYYEWMPENRSFFGHEGPDGGASLFHYVYGDNVHPFKLGQCFNSRSADKIVWEQFTGLKDKNGKDIYEGDIVRRNTYEIWLGNIYPKVTGSEIVFVEWFDSGRWNISDNIYPYGSFLEVIGNIHENPELLTNNN